MLLYGRAGIPAEDLAFISDLVQLDPQTVEFLEEGNDRFLKLSLSHLKFLTMASWKRCKKTM